MTIMNIKGWLKHFHFQIMSGLYVSATQVQHATK